jgi:hypothetical protein
MAKQVKNEIIDLSKFKSENLPELQGKKESIAEVIKNNPIKDVIDNSSYEDMKKSRTAVKTLRTGLERESKEVVSKLKAIVIESVKTQYESLIQEVRLAEEVRQEKVSAWEEVKELERLEKVRLEEERINGIKETIAEFKENWEKEISVMQYENIQDIKDGYSISVSEVDRNLLQEYDVLFEQATNYIDDVFQNKISTLTEQENIRVENLVIAEKKSEQTKIWMWQKDWNSSIDTFKFEDIQGIKEAFDRSFIIGFKHFKEDFNQTFTSVSVRLSMQIEFLSKQEEQRLTDEKNRIAQEKFEKEKAEFEAKKLVLDAKLAESLKPNPIKEVVLEKVELPMLEDKVILDTEVLVQEVEFEESWDSIFNYIADKIDYGSKQDVLLQVLNILQEDYNVPTKK